MWPISANFSMFFLPFCVFFNYFNGIIYPHSVNEHLCLLLSSQCLWKVISCCVPVWRKNLQQEHHLCQGYAILCWRGCSLPMSFCGTAVVSPTSWGHRRCLPLLAPLDVLFASLPCPCLSFSTLPWVWQNYQELPFVEGGRGDCVASTAGDCWDVTETQPCKRGTLDWYSLRQLHLPSALACGSAALLSWFWL